MRSFNKMIFLFAAFTLLIVPALAIMPFAPERTIGLHIGPKNPTFDESKYPDIDFYYTPQIKWKQMKATGSPEVLANWIQKKGLTMNELILFDKKGIVDFTGFLVPGKKIVEVHDLGFLRTLGEALHKIVEEDRESSKKTTKPIKWDWVSDLEGRSFPSFEVYNASGEATTTAAVIGRDEKPKLMIVFRIPYNYKFQTLEEQMEGAEDPMAMFSAVTQMESGEQHTAYLKLIEEELYNR
ncbi:MAG: hypothetical protein ABIH50_06065 [bacterium]